MNLALWIAAGMLALVAITGGSTKSFIPKKKLATIHGAEWTAGFSANAIKTLGALELLATVSFLLNLGGQRAAGFSPETIVEVEANGRIRTQPLAGTRSLGPDAAENDRLREELRTDPKEVHEHAISVRLAAEEMETICRPGSVVIEEFMTVKARGSVQHLASRVAGRLRENLGPWSAFAALFPAVTVVPKSAALAALNRHEPEPRGLYGGAVFRAGTDGSLDAALVLRTLFAHGNHTWLRAGAGIMGQSTPEREYEETCEKLRSVVPHLRFHHR
ncbi:chorismate-binding protein [Streptosporangium sp. NPDC002607]